MVRMQLSPSIAERGWAIHWRNPLRFSCYGSRSTKACIMSLSLLISSALASTFATHQRRIGHTHRPRVMFRSPSIDASRESTRWSFSPQRKVVIFFDAVICLQSRPIASRRHLPIATHVCRNANAPPGKSSGQCWPFVLPIVFG